MKKVRVLRRILKDTGGDKMLVSFLAFTLVVAKILHMVEPQFTTFGDSLWYCYVAIATIGFGDMVVVTTIGRICTIFLSLYSILVIAIITGIVVNFYTELTQLRQKHSLAAFLEKAERLPELSKEELAELARNVSAFRQNK